MTARTEQIGKYYLNGKIKGKEHRLFLWGGLCLQKWKGFPHRNAALPEARR
jgi:hypothetical protein